MPRDSDRRGPRRPASRQPVPPGQLEYEFGIPFPGVIAEPSRWTRTALHKVPPGPLDWTALFGRTAPVVLDIGCGNGRSTLLSAIAHPECDHLAVDTLPVVIRYATRRANQRGLGNVRCAVIGGGELLAAHVAPHTIAAIHVFHPQPYDDPQTSHRRLLTPDFLRLVFRALIPGGKFVLQTDHPHYWASLQSLLPHFFEWHEQPGPWPEAPQGMTRREIMATAKGLSIYRGWGLARTDLTDAAAETLAARLPFPDFPHDPRLRELDRAESLDLAPGAKSGAQRRGQRSTPRPGRGPRGKSRHR